MPSNNCWLAIGCVVVCLAFGTASKPRPSQLDGERAPQEGDACKLEDDRRYSVEGDQSVYLFCDKDTNKLKLHRCSSDSGLFKIYDPKRGGCVEPNQKYRWLLMAAPMNAPVKKVGDACVVNRDCSDGMYCNASNGGICACYLNYIEINLACVRITSVCQGTTFYPEAINGKPKICSASSPCPPGYGCRLETSGNGVGQEQGFCCLATANEVCGHATPHIINGQPVACYYPNATESCPQTHQCQYYQPANRYYCCQNNSPPVASNGSTPAPPPASTKARHVQQPDSFCGNNGLAYLYDGFPIVCNPNNSASCPKDFPCQKNDRISLNFCCQNVTTSNPHPTVVQPPPPPPSPPPPPPLPPFSNLFIPETTASSTVPVSSTAANLGNVVGGAIGKPIDVCGPTARAFIFDARLVTCNVNDTMSCPPTYTCVNYAPFNTSFCCRTSSPSESHLPYDTTVQGTTATPPPSPTLSSAGASSSTPKGSPSVSSQTVCGTWGIPYTFEGYPVTCVHQGLNSTCPPDHICQLHPPSNAHFCCRSPDSNLPLSTGSTVSNSATTSQPFLAISNPDGCPPQTYAARDHNGVIQVCDLQFAPDHCPTGTGCLYSALFGRYQCCGAKVERWPQPTTSTSTTVSSTTTTPTPSTASPSTSTSPPSTTSTVFTLPNPSSTTPATNSTNTKKHASSSKYDECPPGQISYKEPAANETLSCAANHADSCPGGYFCQWSQNAGKFLCCGVSAGCPNQGVAYVSAASWEVQRCSPSDPMASCPPGYICQTTSDGSSVCCANHVSHPQVTHPGEGGPLTNIISPHPQAYLCPVGLPLNDKEGGGYRTCSESQVCPSGYQCVPSSVGTVCCPIYVGKGPNPLWYFHSPINSRSRNAHV